METTTTFKYTLKFRPPSFCTCPAGWRLVEAGRGWTHFPRRMDLPCGDHAFGVIEYDRELTAGEVEKWEMKRV